MPQPPTPQWQLISFMPTLASMIDGMLESAEENRVSLQRARAGSLDDSTVGRVVEVYTTQRDDLWLYDTQLQRWQAAPSTATQRAEVERLQGQVKRLREVIDANLALADKLKKTTIETILGKSDLEIGLEFLMRGGLDEEED